MPAARDLSKDFHLLNRQGPYEKKKRKEKKGKQMDMCRFDLIHNANLAHNATPALFHPSLLLVSLLNNHHQTRNKVPFYSSPSHTANTNAEQTCLAVNMYIIIM